VLRGANFAPCADPFPELRRYDVGVAMMSPRYPRTWARPGNTSRCVLDRALVRYVVTDRRESARGHDRPRQDWSSPSPRVTTPEARTTAPTGSSTTARFGVVRPRPMAEKKKPAGNRIAAHSTPAPAS